ncbi:MAG: hypothetical protein WBM24_12105, partial [Candidatus Sulfotelmatobacter sp.]
LQRGYFKPEAVRSLVDEHVRGRRNRSGLLWRMLVLELWHRNFIESPNQWGAKHAPPNIFEGEIKHSSHTEAPVMSTEPEAASN